MADIDSLQIKIDADTQKAVSAISRLTNAIKSLDNLSKNGGANLGLATVAEQINAFNEQIAGAIDNISILGSAMNSIKGENVTRAMQSVAEAAETLEGVGVGGIVPEVDTEGLERASEAMHETAEAADISDSELKKNIRTMHKQAEAFKKVEKAAKKSKDAIKKWSLAIGRIAVYRAIRAVMSAIANGLKEGAQNAALWSQAMQKVNSSGINANQVMSKLSSLGLYFKDTFGSLAITLLNLFLPILEKVVNAIVRVVEVINQLFAALGGSTTYIKANGNYWNDYAKSLKKASSEAKKSLMAFDEINALQKETSNEQNGLDYKNLFKEVEIDPKIQKIADIIKEALNNVFILLGVGAALFVLGTILVLTGVNIPLGLAMMVAGALMLYKAASIIYDTLPEELKKVFITIMTVVGTFLLAVGAILALSGVNVPLGIALMAMGAVTLGTAAALNWEEMKKQLQGTLGDILRLISEMIAVVGIILIFTGHIPLGIGCLVVGITGTVALSAIKWDEAKNKVEHIMKEIQKIVGASLLAIGVILVVTGNLPFGIAAILAGIGALVTAVSPDDNPIIRFVKGVVEDCEGVIDNAVKTVRGWFDGLFQFVGKVGDFFNGVGEKVQSAMGKVSDYFSGKSSSASSSSGSGAISSALAIANKWKNFQFASGGFPTAGDLFIANEAGAEMVGSMNGRTTVANNQQIVDGIKAGVADAMMEVMMATGGFGGTSSQPVVENVFKVDSETLYRMVQKGQNSYDGRYHIVSEF